MKGSKAEDKKQCLKCSMNKGVSQFYLSHSDFHSDSRYPICKACIKSSLDLNTENANEKIKDAQDILMQMNRPFLSSVWDATIKEVEKTGRDLFGIYIKNIQLNYKDLTWKNSIIVAKESNVNERATEQISTKQTFKFDVTPEMILRWGSNYKTDDDYIKLEDFYHKMKLSNKIETAQDETYLKKLSVISLKMDQELESGNYAQVKQLGDLFSKYMADSKFRAMDKTDADKTGGIRSFSAIFSEVEKDGHIPPWEEYRKVKGITQDIVDKTIMHIENFTLRLNKIERMSRPPVDTPKLDKYGDVE